MAKVSGLFMALGIVFLIYSILGAFIGNPMILSFIRPIKPATGVLLANSLLMLSILGKLSKKA